MPLSKTSESAGMQRGDERTRELKHKHVDHMMTVPNLRVVSLNSGDNERDAQLHLHAGKGTVAFAADV